MIPQGGGFAPPPGGSLHSLATEKFEIRVIALSGFFGFVGNRFKTAVSVSPLSGFSGFLVNRNRFGFGDSGFVFPVPVRFAAILVLSQGEPWLNTQRPLEYSITPGALPERGKNGFAILAHAFFSIRWPDFHLGAKHYF